MKLSFVLYVFGKTGLSKQFRSNAADATVWANSADDKLAIIFFLIFPENRLWHFMQIVSLGDNLHVMSMSVFWKN